MKREQTHRCTGNGGMKESCESDQGRGNNCEEGNSIRRSTVNGGMKKSC